MRFPLEEWRLGFHLCSTHSSSAGKWFPDCYERCYAGWLAGNFMKIYHGNLKLFLYLLHANKVHYISSLLEYLIILFPFSNHILNRKIYLVSILFETPFSHMIKPPLFWDNFQIRISTNAMQKYHVMGNPHALSIFTRQTLAVGLIEMKCLPHYRIGILTYTT